MYDQTTFSILEIRINDMSTYIAVIQDYIFKICIQCMHLLFNHQFSYLIYCISLTMLHMYIEIYTITCTSQIHHTCSSHRCQNNHVIISVQVFLSLLSCTYVCQFVLFLYRSSKERQLLLIAQRAAAVSTTVFKTYTLYCFTKITQL